MLRRLARGGTRGLGVLDVVLVFALLALLIYVLRLDWRRRERAGPPTAPAASARS